MPNPAAPPKFRLPLPSRRMKVSAIVPVYNPGSHIDDCIKSLLGQSLPDDQYEVIFVDDGSTDETPARLDELAAQHANVRVEHIPNSGWPGRPRNVGIDMAHGDYVYFIDNDDWVGEQALERLYDAAVNSGDDIVMGRVVGHGKFIPRGLFKEPGEHLTLEAPQLLSLLTPHKLFRKALLDDHGIRFPEGRRRLEDHMFVMHAYFHCSGVSILTDYPYYHWAMREDASSNASYSGFDPTDYYDNVREVLDLVEEHTDPGPLRDRLLSHWYRGKMLGRVGGRYFPRRDPEYRRALYEEIRKLALERYSPEVDSWLAPNMRVRSKLLRDGDYDALEALAAMEAPLRVDVLAGRHRDEPSDDGDVFIVPFEARLVGDELPLRFERREDRLFWVPPPGVPDPGLEATDDLFNSKVQILMRTGDEGEYAVPTKVNEFKLEPAEDGKLEAVLEGEARIPPGALPAPGRWGMIAVVTIVGFSAVGKVRGKKSAAHVRLKVDDSLQVVRTRRLPVQPPSLAGRVARRVPGLARLARRAKEGRREAAAR
jgi:glycosyltransferase involved in cell wall biosynthesis